jgi:hypothetical protein
METETCKACIDDVQSVPSLITNVNLQPQSNIAKKIGTF